MPFWKKAYNKRPGVYYPQAIVQGEPVETKDLAEELAFVSTVSRSDVNAVLGDIARVMNSLMAQGKSVHIDGLGYFRYVLDTKGVENLEDFDFKKQVKAVRVQFTPEREGWRRYRAGRGRDGGPAGIRREEIKGRKQYRDTGT